MTIPDDKAPVARRRYVSTHRAAGMAERRAGIIAATITMLRDTDRAAAMSVESVARSAGVTRLTVYNQFGSRQGLLEAVAEVLAQSGGIARLAEAVREPDAEAGLAMAVEVFCRFWSSDAAVGSMRDAIIADPDVAAALAARLASRRDLIEGLVRRLRPDWDATRQDDAVDLIRVLVDHPSVTALSHGRGLDLVVRLVLGACRAVLSLPCP